MEVCGNFIPRSIYPWEKAGTHGTVDQEDVWAPEPVWTFWRKKKSFASPAIQSQDRPVCSLVSVPTTLARSETIKYCGTFRNIFWFWFLIY